MRLDRKQALIGFGLAFAVSVFGHTQAQATVRHHHKAHSLRFVPKKHHHRHHHHRRVIDANGNRAEIVGGRPAGCPRQFCACGIRKFLGIPDPSLDLAANWPRKYQQTQPAPYTVAARPGHAFLLLSHIQGDVWLTHDWNSGGHKTRIHPRSIAGYTIVDPHSPRFAAL